MILSRSPGNRWPAVGDILRLISGPYSQLRIPHLWPFWGIRYRAENGSQNEAPLAAIMVQKEGLPNWRWIGRDFRMIFRKSMTNRWGLTAPDFRSLIAAKNASFLAI